MPLAQACAVESRVEISEETSREPHVKHPGTKSSLGSRITSEKHLLQFRTYSNLSIVKGALSWSSGLEIVQVGFFKEDVIRYWILWEKFSLRWFQNIGH